MNDIDQYRRKLSKDEINELPLRRYEGQIVLVNHDHQAPAAVEALMQETTLGFDTETRPAFRKGQFYLPSVLQLASSDCVFIFQLNRLSVFPEELKVILSSKEILKTGVAVADDIKDLQQLGHFEPSGFIDLGRVAHQIGLETKGLRNLAANLLGFKISKSAQVTNWAAQELSEKQIYYAATDAWAGRELYFKMSELGFLALLPPSPEDSEG